MQGSKSRFSKGGMNKGAMMQPRRRRKKIKLPAGHPTDAELISAYLTQNKVTVCPPGYAMGSLASTSFGLESQ